MNRIYVKNIQKQCNLNQESLDQNKQKYCLINFELYLKKQPTLLRGCEYNKIQTFMQKFKVIIIKQTILLKERFFFSQ